jgi:hypothetical protein
MISGGNQPKVNIRITGALIKRLRQIFLRAEVGS